MNDKCLNSQTKHSKLGTPLIFALGRSRQGDLRVQGQPGLDLGRGSPRFCSRARLFSLELHYVAKKVLQVPILLVSGAEVTGMGPVPNSLFHFFLNYGKIPNYHPIYIPSLQVVSVQCSGLQLSNRFIP